MTKDFSFQVRKNAQNELVVIGNELLKNQAGKPIGSLNSDISADVSVEDKASLEALMVSLKAVLEAQ